MTIVVPAAFASFGLWVEQLIAESTGKQGTGCVPVPTTEPEVGADRHVDAAAPGPAEPTWPSSSTGGSWPSRIVRPRARDRPLRRAQRGRVEEEHQRRPRRRSLCPAVETAAPASVLGWLSDTVRPGDYVSLQAYLPFGQDAALEALRRRVRDHLGGAAGHRRLRAALPALDGAAPQGRAEHGGRRPDRRTPDPMPERRRSPGKPYDFGTLIAAQSIGDHRACSPTAGGCCGWPSTTWATSAETAPARSGRSRDEDSERSDDMKIGMVGLGKMGANMTERLIAKGHRWWRSTSPTRPAARLAAKGAETAATLDEMVGQARRRPGWPGSWCPAGAPTDSTIDTLKGCFERGDVVIDGGNSNYKEAARRRPTSLAEKGIGFVDAGHLGRGVGPRQRLLPHGGRHQASRWPSCEPIFLALAPEGGYAHVGPVGAGHFVKMVHNGIEYGLMQAYAEGFEIMEKADEFNLDLHEIASIWRYGSVVRSWLLELAERALRPGVGLRGHRRASVDRLRRGPLDGRGGHRPGRPRPGRSPPSLFARFASREQDSFSNRLVAALRNQFGGHAVVTARVRPERAS